MSTYQKPLPSIDDDIRPFWEACKRHEFVLHRCQRCGAWYFPASYCRHHPNEPFFGTMAWTRASGRGRVFARLITHQAFDPSLAEDIPYCTALIDLEEGPLFMSRVVQCNPSEVTIGMPVEVVFQDVTEEITLPLFKPIAP